HIANFDINEVTPLRLAKLLASPTGSVSNAEIIELSGADIRTHLPDALKALDSTLRFLHSHAGIVPESLPTETGMLPLAYVVAQRPALLRSQHRQRLLSWFWASTFLQRYGRGGTNTLVVADSNEIYNWLLG